MQKPTATPVSMQIAAQLGQLTEQIRQDPEFAKWLIEEYTPIAGGWQY